MAMKYDNHKGRLGVARRRRNYVVRRRRMVPYGIVLPTKGIR